LTVNAVVQRQNLDRLGEIIEPAVTFGADRLEVVHVQYYGWALAKRAALLPSRHQLDTATATVEAAHLRLAGRLIIDYVVPDYYAHRPKACMGGWGRRCLNVSPAGNVLPCHAAETLPGLDFPTVRRRASRISGTAPLPSSSSVGPRGCRSPAAPAAAVKSTGEAAAARRSSRSRWPLKWAAGAPGEIFTASHLPPDPYG
jgi:hypothetical protein